MRVRNVYIIAILCLQLVSGFSQTDSLLLKSFPVRIGNMGFSMDSLEFVIGDVARGSTLIQEVGLYNFATNPIQLKSAQSSPFISVSYRTSILQPAQSSIAMVNFEAIQELPLGPNHIEVVVESDDEASPLKFFYLVVNIVEDSF